MSKYCLTSDRLGGSILFEYDSESGMLVQATIEFVMSKDAATYLATHFPTMEAHIDALRALIKGRIDKVVEIPVFNEFWEKFANKNGKVKAQTAFKRLPDAEKILAVSMIPRYKKSLPAWQNSVMASTYLNEKRYMDFVKLAEHDARKIQA